MKTTTTTARPTWLGIYPATSDIYSDTPQAGVFGDQVVAAAMIDRIVHHADVIALKGASYRLRDRGIDTLPSIKAEQGSID